MVRLVGEPRRASPLRGVRSRSDEHSRRAGQATLRSKYPDEKIMEELVGPNLWSIGYVENAVVSRRRTFALSSQDAPWRDL